MVNSDDYRILSNSVGRLASAMGNAYAEEAHKKRKLENELFVNDVFTNPDNQYLNKIPEFQGLEGNMIVRSNAILNKAVATNNPDEVRKAHDNIITGINGMKDALGADGHINDDNILALDKYFNEAKNSVIQGVASWNDRYYQIEQAKIRDDKFAQDMGNANANLDLAQKVVDDYIKSGGDEKNVARNIENSIVNASINGNFEVSKMLAESKLGEKYLSPGYRYNVVANANSAIAKQYRENEFIEKRDNAIKIKNVYEGFSKGDLQSFGDVFGVDNAYNLMNGKQFSYDIQNGKLAGLRVNIDDIYKINQNGTSRSLFEKQLNEWKSKDPFEPGVAGLSVLWNTIRQNKIKNGDELTDYFSKLDGSKITFSVKDFMSKDENGVMRYDYNTMVDAFAKKGVDWQAFWANTTSEFTNMGNESQYAGAIYNSNPFSKISLNDENATITLTTLKKSILNRLNGDYSFTAPNGNGKKEVVNRGLYNEEKQYINDYISNFNKSEKTDLPLYDTDSDRRTNPTYYKIMRTAGMLGKSVDKDKLKEVLGDLNRVTVDDDDNVFYDGFDLNAYLVGDVEENTMSIDIK